MVKELHSIIFGLAATAAMTWTPAARADAPEPIAAAAPETEGSASRPVFAPEAVELARLEALPACRVPLKGATLASAIRLLAQAARMSYVAPPDGALSDRITSDVTMNPYELLKLLTDTYGVGMEYRRGVWWFYRENLNELVTKAYTLRFNNLEKVAIKSASINSQLASAGGGLTGSLTGGSGGGLGSASSNSGSPFGARAEKIIDDIKKIVGLPTVGVATPSLDDSTALPGMNADRKSLDAPKVEPIWNPDTSQLFVVATRQQHSLIAAYLKAIDQPQKMVRIAVKFVETSRNPTQALGVDWSKTPLGSGGPVTLSGPSVGVTSVASTLPGTSSGTTVTVNSGTAASSSSTSSSSSASSSSTGTTSTSSPLNLITPELPLTLLSAPAFNWTVQAINSDVDSSIVQDPVIYTTNNREVTFKATTQEPVQQGTTTIGSATAATTSTVAYIDVGTEVSVLPVVLPGKGPGKELVQLNLSINVSSIVGSQTINGNPYPVTDSKTYSYSVSVPVGETLAIAGLEDRERQTTTNKVPIFGDIPVLGYAFKNKSDSLVRTTLLAFITPELVDTDNPERMAGGLEAAPVPAFRHRVFQGSPTETLAEVDKSLEGLPYDIEALKTCAAVSNKDVVLNRLEQIEVELSLIDVRLGELRLAGRATARESAAVARDRDLVGAAEASVARLRAEAA